MSPTENPVDDSLSPAQTALRWRARFLRLGVAAFAIGLVAAALIYAFAGATGPDAAADVASGRAYEYDIERIGGKSAVYAARFNQWLGTLWHGRTLAYTVAVIGIVLTAIFLLAAHLATPHGPASRLDVAPRGPTRGNEEDGRD